jgi:starvation-inducible DNA-binding protein
MQTGMSEKSKELIAKKLEVVFVDTYSLYLKTQNAHWNYMGKEFYSLHLLLEKQYQDMADALDEIAERVRALGFFVTASFAFFQKKSNVSIEENLPPSEMIEDLVTGHETWICHARKVCELAEQEKDAATVDLLGKRLGAHEKFLWMLKNYL